MDDLVQVKLIESLQITNSDVKRNGGFFVKLQANLQINSRWLMW